ncbi:MAG: 3-phosphoshikimate 1-carboxyvinyltransferase [Luteimonas sp.]
MTGQNRNDWIASHGQSLSGTLDIPGDKSVSHRAIMLAALADGTSRIDGFLEGEDTLATAAAFAQLGVRIETPKSGVRLVHGVGIDGLCAPRESLDCGNAGTAMRLLAGVLSGQRFDSVLIGDASLTRRPMGRIIDPLSRMGATISSETGFPPLRIAAADGLRAIDFAPEIASAQVKSAVLFAGLFAQGITCVSETQPTRDYTERMLAAFGWPIEFGSGFARLSGGHRLRAIDVRVPADFSSAAFLIVAASIVPGSDLTLRAVGVNPRRTGLLHVLRAMGADIVECNLAELGGEPVADLRVRHAPLHGIEVPGERVPDMIDEFPALFVAAACASGTTVVRGAAELRVKESDRLAAMATGLRSLGIVVEETADGAAVQGGRLRSGAIDSRGDHRVAMAFAVAGQAATGDVRIDDIANVATSFPGFETLARQAGFGLRTP